MPKPSKSINQFKDYEMVYLSARSTNHPGVVPFYQRLGMRVTDLETRPNDLVWPIDLLR